MLRTTVRGRTKTFRNSLFTGNLGNCSRFYKFWRWHGLKKLGLYALKARKCDAVRGKGITLKEAV